MYGLNALDASFGWEKILDLPTLENEFINIEYVSANPTGPLHAAHARGAVVGDTLARLLKKVGFRVCKEYYVNDAGTQVDTLAKSTHLRYLEALGQEIGPSRTGSIRANILKKWGRH